MSHTFLKSARGFFYLNQNYADTLSVDHFLFTIKLSKIRPTDLLITKYAPFHIFQSGFLFSKASPFSQYTN